MSLFVDTSVWSLAFRRDAELVAAEVKTLQHALDGADQVFTTGLVLQELLQGFARPKARDQLIERFAALGFLQPDRQDHTSKPPKSATPAVVMASSSEPSTRCSYSSVSNTIWSCSARTMTSARPQNTSSFACGALSDGQPLAQAEPLRHALPGCSRPPCSLSFRGQATHTSAVSLDRTLVSNPHVS